MCLRPEAFTALPRPLAGLQWFTFKARQGSESVTQTQIYDYTCMQWAGASQHSQGTETMVGGVSGEARETEMILSEYGFGTIGL